MEAKLQHDKLAQLDFLFESYKKLAFKVQSLGMIIHNPSLVENGGMSEWLAEVETRKDELDVLTTLTTKVLGLSNGNGGRLW